MILGMNSFGRKFRVSVFGESHGPYVGVTIDGVPSGLELCEADFASDIDRRRPGVAGTTSRSESDVPQIISGLYEGHTTGAPLTVLFANADVDSYAYGQFRSVPRPGHADFSATERFGAWNDLRGGGHFSGRLTLPIVAAGVVAKKLAAGIMGIEEDERIVDAGIVELGGISGKFCDTAEALENPQWKNALEQAAAQGDSLGAVVECRASVPAGIGDPFWDSVESLMSHAIFSIPGVRGVEFGDGFKASSMKGSEHNDPFGPDGLPAKNGSGGVNGGITNGAPVLFRVAFKPTSSISKAQKTLDFEKGEMTELSIKGRHDVCFALRTPVIVEAMAAIVIADLIL